MSLDLELLDEIATGDLTASAARSLARPFLLDLNAETVQQLYTVLRSWVWNTINERRRGDELRDWSAFIKSVSSLVRDNYRLHAERLMVLHELVHETISVASSYDADVVLGRSHTREILLALRDAPNGFLQRATIRDRFGFKDANLSRVLTMLQSSGLIEREAKGKFASFRLSKEGELKTGPTPIAKIAEAPKPNIGKPGLKAILFQVRDIERKLDAIGFHSPHPTDASPPKPMLAKRETEAVTQRSEWVRVRRQMKIQSSKPKVQDDKAEKLSHLLQQASGRSHYQGSW